MKSVSTYQPYISPYAEVKVPKSNKNVKKGAVVTIAATGFIVTAQPGLPAFAAQQISTLTTEPKEFIPQLKEQVIDKAVSNEVSKAVIETVVPTVDLEEVKNKNDESMQERASKTKQEPQKEEQEKITEQPSVTDAKPIEKKEDTVKKAIEEKRKLEAKIKEEAKKKIAFDPKKEYNKTYESYGKPTIATLTVGELESINGKLIRPVPRNTYNSVSSPFGPRTIFGGKEFHKGVDYPSYKDAPIYAVANGKVIYSGQATGYGNWIVLEHNINGVTLYSIYGHMEAKDLFVKKGEMVKQGQKISAVDGQGRSSGLHLHFSIAKSRNADSPRHFYNYINPTMVIDIEKSNAYSYEGHASQKSDGNVAVNKAQWWKLAKEASAKTGWSPLFIMSQWEIETNHFKSNVLRKNNNIAGQTWRSYMGVEKRGTARPSNEGGYYIKYNNPVDGYVDFIHNNPRYSKVKALGTPEEQAIEVAAQGWAADPNYLSTLLQRIEKNRSIYGDVGIQKPKESENIKKEQDSKASDKEEEKQLPKENKQKVEIDETMEDSKDISKDKSEDKSEESVKDNSESKEGKEESKSPETEAPTEEMKKEESNKVPNDSDKEEEEEEEEEEEAPSKEKLKDAETEAAPSEEKTQDTDIEQSTTKGELQDTDTDTEQSTTKGELQDTNTDIEQPTTEGESKEEEEEEEEVIIDDETDEDGNKIPFIFSQLLK